MLKQICNWILPGFIILLAACGGGGGGDRAVGVQPGPPAPGGQVFPPPPIVPAPNPAPYAEAEELFAVITSVTLDQDSRPIVEWQLSDGNNTGIIDLPADRVRFTIAKLQGSPLGNMTGTWQSYINQIEQPGVGPGLSAKLQATYESDAGEFTNNLDGTYRYHFDLSLGDLPADVLAQAAGEGLDLSFEPERTHRVAMQFIGAPGKANPVYDWQPSTGATSGIFTMDVAATANCNRCHDVLAIHEGESQTVKQCVTCHNPGSSDANSGNLLDMKVMLHKIHRGKYLPSVEAGGEYAFWGMDDSKHDYSKLGLPQDIRNCVNCHAGTSTGAESPDLVLTSNGDNWTLYPSRAACGSCHDDVNFLGHQFGQPDDSDCASCHTEGGVAGSIQDNHQVPGEEARNKFLAEIVAVTNTSPGEFPRVQYKVFDPTNGNAPYDLQNDVEWTAAASRLAIDVAWSTIDYANTGNADITASAVSLDALQGTPQGDGSYIIDSGVAIPDGTEQPFIAANGSGVVVIEGQSQQAPLSGITKFFSISEPGGEAVPRRTVVDLDKCLDCHQTLSLHNNDRTDNLQSCVTCHNPRNTDRDVRAVAVDPPTDGKDEESLDFKQMIHGIHAASMRVSALQIVGSQGLTTRVYDEDAVHYPGNLANCSSCHVGNSDALPLVPGVLGTTVDTGLDQESPLDDKVITPVTAVCSSCHDDAVATAHMKANGGSFDSSQQAIDDKQVVEQCTLCHATNRAEDAGVWHNMFVN